MAYLLLYGELPSAKELARFEEAVGRHSAVPSTVEDAINALPHDAHFMGSILVGVNALSTCHPEQNPALAGQDVYNSKEIQDKQIVRLIGMSLFQLSLSGHQLLHLPGIMHLVPMLPSVMTHHLVAVIAAECVFRRSLNGREAVGSMQSCTTAPLQRT